MVHVVRVHHDRVPREIRQPIVVVLALAVDHRQVSTVEVGDKLYVSREILNFIRDTNDDVGELRGAVGEGALWRTTHGRFHDVFAVWRADADAVALRSAVNRATILW